MTTLFIYADLERDEGRRYTSYQDTLGNWTIGVGHHDKHIHAGMVWKNSMIDNQLRADVSAAERALDGSPLFAWWRDMNGFRQDALLNMCFNMGAGTLVHFVDYLQLLRAGLYAQAAEDELHTLWARQVGDRAKRIAEQIRTGLHQQ